MFLFIGTPELILVGIVVLLIFGADKIPDFARGLGKIIRQAKDARSFVSDEIAKGIREADEVKKTVEKTTEEAVKSVEDPTEKSLKKQPEAPKGAVKR